MLAGTNTLYSCPICYTSGVSKTLIMFVLRYQLLKQCWRKIPLFQLPFAFLPFRVGDGQGSDLGMEGVYCRENKEPRCAAASCVNAPNALQPQSGDAGFPEKIRKRRASFFRQASFEPPPIARTLWERKRGDRSVTFDRAEAERPQSAAPPAGTRRPTQVAHHSVCLMR